MLSGAVGLAGLGSLLKIARVDVNGSARRPVRRALAVMVVLVDPLHQIVAIADGSLA